MQVITGKYRAKKLRAPGNNKTRPTLQRAKETIFNMLPHQLYGKLALDVFAGSGQLGLEALSRGIRHCHFNELDSDALSVLKLNLKSIPSDEFTIFNLDYKDVIQKLKDHKYNLILIDPPYPIAQKAITHLLAFIDDNDMLAQNGLIIGEAPRECLIKEEFTTFKLKKVNHFSKLTRIWQYEKK